MRHTLLLNPYVAELTDTEAGSLLVEGGDQVVPGGIAVGVICEVLLQAALHDVGLHHLLEHAHHDGGLVVDDVVVEQAGVVEVVELLCDGVGTLCTVDGDGLGLIGLDEVEGVVHLIILATGNLGCHEVGEDLLGPYILEPLGCYEVAEPEVSRLVCDELGACQELLLGGILLEEDPAGVELDGSRVLHATELIAGDEYDAILVGEGVGNACIAFEPLQGCGSLVEHLVELCHLLRVGLAVEGAHLAAVARGGLLVEVTCHEGVEVGGQWAATVAGHGLPAVGHVELRQVAGPEVGLVEAWED